jgi:hypothetical protein
VPLPFRLSALWLLLACACAGTTPTRGQGPSQRVDTPAPVAVARAAPRPSAPPAPSATPSLPFPPEVDLAAELQRKRDLVRDELGDKAHAEVVERVFLVAAPGGKGAVAGAIDVTKKALGAYFNDRFSRRPGHAISVYLFPNARRYDAYCKKRWEHACSSPYGFYLGSEREIIMNVAPGIGTLTHELVHPLVQADFPSAPDWLNEGIASLFERFYFPAPGEIRGGKNWRHPRLIAALRSKNERDLARPSALFGMGDEVFRGEKEDLNYATARYFCQWLDQHGELWPFYQRWRDSVDGDPTGEKAFEAVTGKAPADIDADWTRWVRAL